MSAVAARGSQPGNVVRAGVRGGFGTCAGGGPGRRRPHKEKPTRRAAAGLASLPDSVRPRLRGELSAWWRERERVCVRSKERAPEAGSPDSGLAEPGASPRALEGVPASSSVPSLGAPERRASRACPFPRAAVSECRVARNIPRRGGRGFGGGGLSPQACAKEGVAFV